MSEHLTGRLLIAGPGLGDPNFDRTIVYLLEHGPGGSLGVVLNRPSEIELLDALPQWAPAVARPPVLFSGGPVEAAVALGLARVHDPLDCAGWSPIDGDIGSFDLGMSPGAIVAGVDVARVFVGYSGWSAEQLDEELAAGAWFVVDAAQDDVFTEEPDHLWGSILRREQARMAMADGNPSWN